MNEFTHVRAFSKELDEVLGHRFNVLDDGFIRVIDYMGNDSSIVQAARVSYGAGTKRVHKDRGLIRYLMRHGHTTPFEMCEIELQVRVPMDCWRQWIRHRTANVNEYSTRYSIAIDKAQRTPADAWRLQDTASRQGSSGELPVSEGSVLSNEEMLFQDRARKLYLSRLEIGVAREQARKDLPLSTYTEAYWKIDLHNLLHFLRLRMDSHAQREIRSYANVIGNEIVSRWCPMVWEAFQDYRLNGISLTRAELLIASAMIQENPSEAINIAHSEGWLNLDGKKTKKNRERDEAEGKLASLGIKIPWS